MTATETKLTWDKAARPLFYSTLSKAPEDTEAPWLVRDDGGDYHDAFATQQEAEEDARERQAESNLEADAADAESEAEAIREAVGERLVDLDVTALRLLARHLGI